MFRIEYLKLFNHPQLGNIELDLSEDEGLSYEGKPYTTVIIGPNGTGKSFILRTIAEIFRQFFEYSKTGKKNISLPFRFHLRYKLDDNIYEIISTSIIMVGKDGTPHVTNIFYKNRPESYDIISMPTWEHSKSEYEISIENMVWPSKLLVSAINPSDRFVFQHNQPAEFYQYLGARNTAAGTTTKSASRKAISHLFNSSIEGMDFVINLKDLLLFIGFEESLKITYTTKINKLFFSGNLTKENFIKYYEEWWDPEFTFTKRKKENAIWSIPYYNNNFKDKKAAIDELVNYLNGLVSRTDIFQKKPKSSSRYLIVDLLNGIINQEDIKMLKHLESLDIINLNGIHFKKGETGLSIDEISSGEYHLLVALISMFSNIKQNSIVLIDEPEISLHPNWQMRYMSFLKEVFSNFQSCHFIITSHSHFIVSDLEGNSSKVIGLSKGERIEVIPFDNINTFGWSAEDVLYRVFNVKTTSNYFLEMDLRNALILIKNKSKGTKELDVIIERLNKLQLNQADPTNEIIKDIKKYRSSL